MTALLDSLHDAEDSAAVLQRVADHFGATTATLHLLGPDGMLHLQATAGYVPTAVYAAIEVVPVGKGIAGLTVQSNEPVDLCNLQTDASGTARPAARSTGVGGSMCVPVRRAGRAVGALGVGTAQERTFTAEEISLLLRAAEYVPELADFG